MNTEKMPLKNANEPSCLGAVMGSYIAYHIKLKKAMLVYNMIFSGYPTPRLSAVTLLKDDHSDYFDAPIEDVVVYNCP